MALKISHVILEILEEEIHIFSITSGEPPTALKIEPREGRTVMDCLTNTLQALNDLPKNLVVGELAIKFLDAGGMKERIAETLEWFLRAGCSDRLRPLVETLLAGMRAA